MSVWLERVRAALAPEGYDVVRELASGGMGTVFLARQRALDRLVAIKIIRPELHTALAVRRFRQEAKTLASFSHKNIVSIHDHGETDGMPFYVMEYLEGETLADRLRRGPIPRAEVLSLGRDLLTALEAAHARGVVHRDVKPSNLFLLSDRAVLTDFGLAKGIPADVATTSDRERLTMPGQAPGTPLYMAPEQQFGFEATPLSDLYSAALVIYEAYTGRYWRDRQRRTWRRWRGVPRPVRGILRRALSEPPEDRWSDAVSFRGPFWHSREQKYQWRTVGLAALGLLVGAGFAYWLAKQHEEERWPFKPRVALRIQVEPFQGLGGANSGSLGDSLARGLVSSLTGYPDFSVDGPKPTSGLSTSATIVLSGAVRVTGDSLRVDMEARSGRRGAGVTLAPARGSVRRLDLVVDSLSYAVVRWIWDRENPLDPSLPVAALPKTARGLAAWLRAERLLAQAQWVEADLAYQAAEAIDSTCSLCIWRHAEVDQWLAKEVDSSVTARYLRNIDSFPPRYRILMRAPALPERARLEELKVATSRWRDFSLAWFMRGDELYHRGPLVGHARSEAIEAFQRAAQLRPDFAPAWEHLTWAHTAEGDSAAAAAALESLERSGVPPDPFARVIRALLTLGVAWRFHGTAEARRVMQGTLGQPEIAGYPELAAGPRYLMTFDVPRGAIELGANFAALPNRGELARSGLIAQVVGYVALGMMDSAFARAATLADRFPDDPNLALLGPELNATLLLVEHEDWGAKWASVRAALERQNQPGTGTPQSRQRAAWMLAVSARELGDPNADRYRRLFAAAPAPQPLTILLVASVEAARGNRARALAAMDSLTQLDASDLLAVGDSDPFYRAVLHLLRAQWQMAEGNRDGARRELLWYQANDYNDYPTGDVQVGDVDAGFGTEARWQLARLLDAEGGRGDAACHAYADVQRLWSQGDARYRARADTAARRLAELNCKAGS